jgi:shikimate kinase
MSMSATIDAIEIVEAPGTMEAIESMDEAESGKSERGADVPVTVERVVLTGFMGSGKTTTGRLLAERLGWSFRDLDSEVEAREGRTVPQIFAESGEAAFRRAEASALASLLGRRQVVIALGGGAPEGLGNRLLLEQTPKTAVVYLKAPLETLVERCLNDTENERPLLAEAAARFTRRHPLYERVARHRVTTTGMPAIEVVAAILRALEG